MRRKGIDEPSCDFSVRPRPSGCGEFYGKTQCWRIVDRLGVGRWRGTRRIAYQRSIPGVSYGVVFDARGRNAAVHPGTAERHARSHCALRGPGLPWECRADPIMFFFLASILASIGPGSMAMAAIIGPMAMRVAGRAK